GATNRSLSTASGSGSPTTTSGSSGRSPPGRRRTRPPAARCRRRPCGPSGRRAPRRRAPPGRRTSGTGGTGRPGRRHPRRSRGAHQQTRPRSCQATGGRRHDPARYRGDPRGDIEGTPRGPGRLTQAMNTQPRLSVLDLVPVRSGQTSAQALAASLDLVTLADRLGLERYWFAEHHNMAAVAASSPPVMIAAAAARTSRIRVGSGGVMLPNHAPLVVAEQFAALEAMAPGRIDLGIGRAPGSDPVVTSLLRATGPTADVDRFPQHVTDILSLMVPDGARLRLVSGDVYDVHATPAAEGTPTVWLLGSSDYSARLAAELCLPYVFANHFSGQGMEQILRLYRAGYQPSEAPPEPRTFVTANAVVAPTTDEAHDRALP